MEGHVTKQTAASAGHDRQARVNRIAVSAYRIPTDAPESDGTLKWDSTTLILVQAAGGGKTGLGYSYSHETAAALIDEVLAPRVQSLDVMAVTKAWLTMRQAVRNVGRSGIGASAIAALDNALWDLKARLLEVSLLDLLGAQHDAISAYGSGGFTSYSTERLVEQLGGWAAQGMRYVKMKVGRQPENDVARVRAAADAIGADVELFVDANGAYSRKQALSLAEEFAESGVTWFEEPVSSDDLEGLRLLRDRAPAGMDITAGEYGYDSYYFRRMLEAGAVDVLQPDATRCAGISGFIQAAALCEAYQIPFSAHTAPALHAPLCCALPGARHIEYFHDHVRIESRLFDGAPSLAEGALRPDRQCPGLGLTFRFRDAEPYCVLGDPRPITG